MTEGFRKGQWRQLHNIVCVLSTTALHMPGGLQPQILYFYIFYHNSKHLTMWHIKNHWIVHLKRAHCREGELYPNEAVLKPSGRCEPSRGLWPRLIWLLSALCRKRSRFHREARIGLVTLATSNMTPAGQADFGTHRGCLERWGCGRGGGHPRRPHSWRPPQSPGKPRWEPGPGRG